jgi:hypothetical protein
VGLPEPFVVNISSVYAFKACPLRWYYGWVLNRVPRGGTTPMEFGKLLHLIFESHLGERQWTMDQAIGYWSEKWVQHAEETYGGVDSIEYKDALAAVEELDSFAEPLGQWKDKYPVGESIAVEKPFELPHPLDPSILVRGRPDREALIWGRLCHIQNRSLDGNINSETYAELMKNNYHELIYAWARSVLYSLQYPQGGTLLNLLKKVKYRDKRKKDPAGNPRGKIIRDLSALMSQWMVPMSDRLIERALIDLKWDADQMRRIIFDAKNGKLPSSNRKMDGGFFGNKIDPYFYVITGKRDLMDNTYFKDRENTYERTEANKN